MIAQDKLLFAESTDKRRLQYSNFDKVERVDSSHGIGSPAPASGEFDAPGPFVCLGCWLGIPEFDDLPGDKPSSRKKMEAFFSNPLLSHHYTELKIFLVLFEISLLLKTETLVLVK